MEISHIEHGSQRGSGEHREQRGHNHADYRNPGKRTDYKNPGDRADYRRPGEHTDHRKPGEHTDYRKPGEHTDHRKPGEHTDHRKPGEHVHHRKPGEHVHHRKPGEHREHNRRHGTQRGYIEYRNYINYTNYRTYQNYYNEGNTNSSYNKELNIDREQTDNLRASTIDSSISNVGTKSDLIVQKRSIERSSETSRKSIDYSNMDLGEAFKQGGLAGLFDKVLSNCTNMTPGQKDTWKTLGVLGCFAGGIFGLYKFYTSKKLKWRGKVGITAATIFGSQAITGEGPISLFTKLITGGFSSSEMKNKLGSAVSSLSNSGSEAAETTVPAMQAMMIFNSGATAGEVRQITKTFETDTSNENRKNFYNQSCSKLKNEYGEGTMRTFQSTFSNNFNEEKRKNWLASIGITESTDSKKTVHELANNANMNKAAFEKFLTDYKVKPTTDPTKKTELDNYIKSKNEKNESIDFNDLKAHINERFTKESNGTPPESTSTPNPEIQIDNKIEQAIKNGLEKIYSHFEPKIKKINNVPLMKNINRNDITKRFPELTKIIKSEFVTLENNSVIINIDETKMANIFDNFLKKLRGPESTVPKYVKNAISDKSWASLKSQLKEYKNKKNQTKYNNMRENFTVIFNNIFVPIESTLKDQNVSANIKCNGQSFNNVNDAINSMEIFKI